jgi:hypothetical protein
MHVGCTDFIPHNECIYLGRGDLTYVDWHLVVFANPSWLDKKIAEPRFLKYECFFIRLELARRILILTI